MRGREDADVDVLGLASAHGRHLAALQHPQQLGLQLGRHVADLVEEEGPAGRPRGSGPHATRRLP